MTRRRVAYIRLVPDIDGNFSVLVDGHLETWGAEDVVINVHSGEYDINVWGGEL